jgi:MFS family permease
MAQAGAMGVGERRTLALICTGHFMSHFWSITMPALFTVLSEVFNVNFVQLGLMMTVYSIANALCQIPCGVIVDRYGPKWILVGGIFLNGIAFAGCALAPNYATLLVLMLIAGTGQAVFHPADYAILSALFPKERAGKTYAVHTFMGFSGGAAAPIIVAGLASIFNWQVSLAVTGIIGIGVGLLIAVLMVAPELEKAVPAPNREREQDSSQAWHASVSSMLSPTLLLLFCFFVFSSMYMSGIRSFLPSTLTALLSMSNGTANAILTAFMTALAVGVLLGGVFADRTANQGRFINGFMLIGVVLMILIALFRLPSWALFLVLIVAGLAQGAVSPSRDKMVREAAPQGSAGKSFAFVSVGLSVGGIVAPLVLGALLDQNEAALVFWVLAIFSVVAMVTVLLPGRTSPGVATQEPSRGTT